MNQPVKVTEESLAEASAILNSGGVVAFPTETYYGLAVDPWNELALKRLFHIKKRPSSLPILVVISHIEQIALLAESMPESYKRLIDVFWPGPLTLVFPAQHILPALLLGKTGTIALRYSSNDIANELIAVAGKPLTATSANISGYPAAVTAHDVSQIFGSEIDLILDGGPTPGGCSSTLVGCKEATLYCLREGCVPFSSVEACVTQPNNGK